MKKNIIKIGVIGATMFPLFAFAQQRNLEWLVGLTIRYLGYAVFIIIALAVVMFVWNVFKYFILGNDNPAEKKEAGLYVMWSLIGFFVILSLWGLVAILVNTFKLDDARPANFFGIFGSGYVDTFGGQGSGNTKYPGPGGISGKGNPGPGGISR